MALLQRLLTTLTTVQVRLFVFAAIFKMMCMYISVFFLQKPAEANEDWTTLLTRRPWVRANRQIWSAGRRLIENSPPSPPTPQLAPTPQQAPSPAAGPSSCTPPFTHTTDCVQRNQNAVVETVQECTNTRHQPLCPLHWQGRCDIDTVLTCMQDHPTPTPAPNSNASTIPYMAWDDDVAILLSDDDDDTIPPPTPSTSDPIATPLSLLLDDERPFTPSIDLDYIQPTSYCLPPVLHAQGCPTVEMYLPVAEGNYCEHPVHKLNCDLRYPLCSNPFTTKICTFPPLNKRCDDIDELSILYENVPIVITAENIQID